MTAFVVHCCVPRPRATAATVANKIANHCYSDPRFDNGEDRYVVGIAGVPGSGKTTVAAILASLLKRAAPHTDPRTLSMDGWHYSRAQLDSDFVDSTEAHARRGAPWTFDAKGFADALRRCKSPDAGTLAFPSFSHARKDPVEDDVEVPPSSRVLIVEGNYLALGALPDPCYSAWAEARQYIDLLVYLSVPSIDVAMERVKARHVQDMGLSPEDAAFRVRDNDRPNAELVETSADAVAGGAIVIGQ